VAPLTIPREVVSKPAADRGSHPAFVIFICENLTILVMRRRRRSAGPRSGQPPTRLLYGEWVADRLVAFEKRIHLSNPLCTGQRFDRGKAPTNASDRISDPKTAQFVNLTPERNQAAQVPSLSRNKTKLCRANGSSAPFAVEKLDVFSGFPTPAPRASSSTSCVAPQKGVFAERLRQAPSSHPELNARMKRRDRAFLRLVRRCGGRRRRS
jgi:hypothetical protein